MIAVFPRLARRSFPSLSGGHARQASKLLLARPKPDERSWGNMITPEASLRMHRVLKDNLVENQGERTLFGFLRPDLVR